MMNNHSKTRQRESGDSRTTVYHLLPSSLFEVPDSQAGSKSRKSLQNGEPSKPFLESSSSSSTTPSCPASISQAFLQSLRQEERLPSTDTATAIGSHENSKDEPSRNCTRETTLRLVSQAIDILKSDNDQFLSSWVGAVESEAAFSFPSSLVVFGDSLDDPPIDQNHQPACSLSQWITDP